MWGLVEVEREDFGCWELGLEWVREAGLDPSAVLMVVMEKNGQEFPDFFSRLRCSSLWAEGLNGSG
jgi:hypothetical protein